MRGAVAERERLAIEGTSKARIEPSKGTGRHFQTPVDCYSTAINSPTSLSM